MSSFSQNRRRKNAKTDVNELDDENTNNEEEEDANDEDADSSSSKEYDAFDSSPDQRRSKRRKNQMELQETEMSKRSTGRMRRKNFDNQLDQENLPKIKKRNQNENEKNDDYSLRNSSENSKKNRSKRLLALLKDLKSSITQLECEFESPSLSACLIEDFLNSNQNSIDSIIQCFSTYYDEYKRFLKSFSLNSAFNEMYEYIRSLEIEILSIKEDDPNLSTIQSFINKIEKIRSPVNSIEPFDSLVNIIRLLTENLPKESTIYEIISKIYNKLIPMCLFFNSLNLTNYFIHVIDQASESFETLSTPIPEYNNIELQPYESSILQTYQPNPYYTNHCLELVSELEKEGLIMTSSEIIADKHSLVKIVAPNIQRDLSIIHDSLVIIADETQNETTRSISNDICQKPISIAQLFMLEKKIALANVQDPKEARVETLRVLRRFRILHSLFLILDSEKLISYSNAVHLTYFRTFASELAHENLLSNQPLLTPFDKDALVEIAHKTTKKVNADLIDQRIQFKIWLYMSSVDVFSVGFGNPDDSFHTYLQWFNFFTTIQAETDKSEFIIESMEKLPPLSEYKEKVLSFLTEKEFELPNISSVVHLQLIFQAELSDARINYQLSRINQIRTRSYLNQYRKMLKDAIDYGFIRVPEDFSMDDDIRSFHEHHWDLKFNDILPFLYDLFDLLPPLSPSTVDLHIAFARLHSGYISYENVARFGEVSLKHSTEFSNPQEFVENIEKFSHYALFLDFHDQLINAHALASDPSFSMIKNINNQILCRTIANQLLMLNTASVFEASKSKGIACECNMLRLIADAINPALREDPKIRDKLVHCIHNISDFFESSNYGLHGILNQVRINFALNKIENDELRPLMDEAIEAFNKIEPSIQMNQDIIEHYFELHSVITKIRNNFPSEDGQCDFIMNNIKLVAIISQLKEALITAENVEHPFNCIFPVSIKDKMGKKVPILSSIQPMLISKNHFPIPDKPLNISQQNRLINLFKSLQEDRQKLADDISYLQELSEKRIRLQDTVTELLDEKKLLIDDFNSNRKEMEKLYAQMADRKSQNEQRSNSLVVEGGKVTPEELKIEIEQSRRISKVIRERIKLIETQLSCYESSLNNSNEDVLSIEKELIDIQIQKSIIRQKNQIVIELTKVDEKEDEELLIAEADDIVPQNPESSSNQNSTLYIQSTQLNPVLHTAIPNWVRVPEKVFTKIEKGINSLNKMTEEAGALSKKYIEKNTKKDAFDMKESEIDGEKATNENEDDKREIEELIEEIKMIKKKRDVLNTFIQKSKKAVENLLNNM